MEENKEIQAEVQEQETVETVEVEAAPVNEEAKKPAKIRRRR